MTFYRQQNLSLPCTSRDTYWDIVKALLIFLVIWGHTIQVSQCPTGGSTASFWDSPFFKGIYLFHMPLFMGISGYFAAASTRKRGKEALKRYSVRLLIPCITYAVLYTAMEGVLNRTISTFTDKIAILWFLFILFENVCLYYIFRHCSSLISKTILVIMPPFLVATLSPHAPFLFPAANQFTYHWPIFLLGATLYEKGYTSSGISKRLSVLMLLIIPLSLYVPKEIFVYITPLDLSATALAYDTARTLIAIVLCAAFLGLTQCIIRLDRCTLIQHIGRSTLALYVLQSIFFSGVKVLFRHGFNGLPDIVIFLLALVLLLLLYGLYVLLRRLPIVPFLLFGEKKL